MIFTTIFIGLCLVALATFGVVYYYKRELKKLQKNYNPDDDKSKRQGD